MIEPRSTPRGYRMARFVTIAYRDEAGYQRTAAEVRALHERRPAGRRVRAHRGRDLAEAVEMVSGTPCAVAHGVVEVWPLDADG
jgi:hypothetical protein